MPDQTPEPLVAGSPRSLAEVVECVKKTGGAVEIQGVRIEPCDERGETATTRIVDVSLESLRWMEGKRLRALSLIHHLMRSRRRWQGEAFEHLFTYSLENTERVDTQRQLDAARARLEEEQREVNILAIRLGEARGLHIKAADELAQARGWARWFAAERDYIRRALDCMGADRNVLTGQLWGSWTLISERDDQLAAARARIAELEAAQTEPIGYAVVTELSDCLAVQPSAVLSKPVAVDRVEGFRTEFGFYRSRVVELREVRNA